MRGLGQRVLGQRVLGQRVLGRLQARQDERGVVLVLWVLSLTALVGFLALTVNLGNFAQQSENVQDAADAAALSGATLLAPSAGTWDQPSVLIAPSYQCGVNPATGQLSGCASYGWLDGYYVFEQGWWERIVAGAPQAGEVQDAVAFGTLTGAWHCYEGSWLPWTWCYYTGPSGPQDGSLTGDYSLLEAASQAANRAEALVEQAYGVATNWSGCQEAASTLPPEGFSFPDWGQDCFAYELTGCGAVVWVGLVSGSGPSLVEAGGAATLRATAWATATPPQGAGGKGQATLWSAGPPSLSCQ